MKNISRLIVLALLVAAAEAAPRVEITLSSAVRTEPVTGRFFFFLTRDGGREPRIQAGSYTGSVPFFGVDVENLAPGRAAVVDEGTLGFPVRSLKDIPAGKYYAQALVNVYTRFARSDGHVIWAHMDQWEGQRFNISPGNLVSEARRVRFDPASHETIRFELTRILPPVTVPQDTEWVKRVKIQSKLLSLFWGQPIYLGATLLLPKGYDRNPRTKYPAIYIQGHFGLGAPFGFTPQESSETPAAREARLRRSARETGYEFYKAWTSGALPPMVAITFQHPTPYYDDSYAVNSANNGPYGDALLRELIPYLEEKFGLIPEPHARFLTGGSTGGWESLALQIHHPEFFGGTWSLYPDPVDFRRYQHTNAYEDASAFTVPNSNGWLVPERFIMQTEEGQPLLTVRQMSQLEAVLGSRARSGQQINAWDAAYGPVGADGYPRELWNKLTGKIDREVALYMRDHGYDLTYYLKQNWPRIGNDLAGKIHVYTGEMDNFYLNLAVYLMEDFLKSATDPRAEAAFEYGRPMKPHGWQPFTNAELVRMMAERMNKHAAAAR
jgi:hypothetical protein